MHLILIADIHLSDLPANSFGVDTKANFEHVLERVSAHSPDHVVMMGDYSLKAPRREDVLFASAKLKKLGLPYSFIAGNHDRSFDVSEAFPGGSLVNDELYYRKEFGNFTGLFLDTAKAEISELQLAWLKRQLVATSQQALVFMHHPPIEMGVPFMDNKHSFNDPEREVYKVLFGGTSPVHVFSGHYHTARSTQVERHSIHLCPSTYFQLNPMQEEFGVSHAMPGIRHVELIDNQVRTWIEFLPNRP